MDTGSLPPRVTRLDESSSRYAKVQRRLAPGKILYSIYEYREWDKSILDYRKWDPRRVVADAFLILLILLLTLLLRANLPKHAYDAKADDFHRLMFVLWMLFLLLSNLRNATWYAFSHDKVYVGARYRAGLLFNVFAVERGAIEKVDILSARFWPFRRFRVEATLRDGKTVVLHGPDSDRERTKWFADLIGQWLRQ